MALAAVVYNGSLLVHGIHSKQHRVKTLCIRGRQDGSGARTLASATLRAKYTVYFKSIEFASSLIS